MTDAIDHVEGVFRAGNLLGVPSYHFDPHFAQAAARALVAFKPSCVALELPDGLIDELAWASACWPGPVVAASSGALFPFVPGDSMFEAYRLAIAAGIPVVLIDLPAAGSPNPPPGPSHSGWVGPELARAGSRSLLETVDALVDAEIPQARHEAREAHMARKLSQLLADCKTVMWVGGMAHWTRIVRRIQETDFEAPSVALETYSLFRRMRLAPSALYRTSGRLPWLVDRFAQDPGSYDEHAALQALGLEAGRISDTEAPMLVLSGPLNDDLDILSEMEPATPIDIVRMLQYARNLAATGSLRERPSLGELLTSAMATIGPRYAGQIYELATSERASELSLKHEPLEWQVLRKDEVYRCGINVLSVRPWTPPAGGMLPSLVEVRRRARDELYKDLPPRRGGKDKQRWECDPDDEDAYIAFIEYALRRASMSSPEEAKSVPFQTGMRDGLDVRATLRNWTEDTIYVREDRRGHQDFTNGAIDWANTSEHSDLLTGKESSGWIDPDFTKIASASLEGDDHVVLQQDPWIQRDFRRFTLVSLDSANKIPGKGGFYDRVTMPLVHLKRTPEHNLYEWLDIMFRFCARKPFAYYSTYVPSPEIHSIAWKHKVQVVHFPLHRLPFRLLERNRSFRFLALTREQWTEFNRRRSARTATWSRPE